MSAFTAPSFSGCASFSSTLGASSSRASMRPVSSTALSAVRYAPHCWSAFGNTTSSMAAVSSSTVTYAIIEPFFVLLSLTAVTTQARRTVMPSR